MTKISSSPSESHHSILILCLLVWISVLKQFAASFSEC